MKPEKTAQGLWALSIKDKTFEFQKWGAEEQTDTLIDLMSVVGPALGSLANVYKQADDIDAQLSDGVVQKLVGALSSGLSKDKAMSKRLMRKLSSDRILCDGRSINYDTFYQEDLLLAFQVMRAAITVQFGPFFQGVGSLMPARPAAEKSMPGPA